MDTNGKVATPSPASPPSPRSLAVTWVVIAAAVGGGMLVESGMRNGADGANPIKQRTGFVYVTALAAPKVSGPVDGRRTAVLFVRPDKVTDVCTWAAGRPIKDVTMVVVAPEQKPCKDVPFNVDHDAALARGFRLGAAKDGGYPMGFAVLDSDGGFRYSTLDRDFYLRNWWDRHLYKGKKWEMQTVMKEVS